jgi:hypothetical protein
MESNADGSNEWNLATIISHLVDVRAYGVGHDGLRDVREEEN